MSEVGGTAALDEGFKLRPGAFVVFDLLAPRANRQEPLECLHALEGLCQLAGLEPEPRGMAVLTVVLLAICLGIGLYPQPLLTTINEAIRGLTFIQPL